MLCDTPLLGFVVLGVLTYCLLCTISDTIVQTTDLTPYHQLLSDNGFIQSMNRNGNCYDNAIFVKKQN